MQNVFEMFPLREKKLYTESCCDLLNEEWPRSKDIRLGSLQESQDGLPMSLILLEEGNLIGYCHLARVVSDDDSCFISSVVVWKSLRGRGFGRRIMESAETLAARLNFKKMYLTTHDKRGFYERMGFTRCEPVVHATSTSNALQERIKKLLSHQKNSHDQQQGNNRETGTKDNDKDVSEHALNCTSNPNIVREESNSPSVPSAPPLPPVAHQLMINVERNSKVHDSNAKIWMMKAILS